MFALRNKTFLGFSFSMRMDQAVAEIFCQGDARLPGAKRYIDPVLVRGVACGFFVPLWSRMATAD